ncbi:MAG: EscU/YscU/HrcU family type III secretion system export apparatus switch protein [Verrucomicrobiales bacterium]|nr:EscU/YscU/HrcU family type III secretion system export apparatus switch protein [Verrucomicrobiales bacterium]
MSEDTGEKTEQPTAKRLEEAWSRGQFARSAEIQTVVVLGAGFMALMVTGGDAWRMLGNTLIGTLGHLHEIPLSLNSMQRTAAEGAAAVAWCVGPIVGSIALAALLVGGMQSRFRTATEALRIDWERVNPMGGFQRIFSTGSSVALAIGLAKLVVIGTLTWNVIRGVMDDPIFTSAVDLVRIGEFMTGSARSIVLRVLFSLGVIAVIDYGYQFYKTQQDLMMTKEELKEEVKHSEGNPQMKGRMRRRAQALSKRKMLQDVATADVVVTNPTHLAVALRYDRKTMRAPKIVAKGSRLNALRIREIATQNQVPILENKPLARMMFKHGRVGAEIPANLYAAVAEVLAWVYRVNAYRYYREQHGTV